MSVRIALIAALCLGGCAAATSTAPALAPLPDAIPGQRAWAAACTDADEWDKPGPAFRIAGNTYYVGTCGITSLLIAGDQGHILIDSGTDAGAKIVLGNIASLGFDPRDVKLLLMSHEHFDHVGGMARLQEATGATIVASPAAAAVLRSGAPGSDDPQAGSDHPPFPPVRGPITVLRAAEPQRLGAVAVRPIRTPGHTRGALSWTWRDCDDGTCQDFVYADSLNPISADGYRFSDHPALVGAFRAGIAAVAATPCTIALAPHPGAAALRARLAGDKPLVDQAGCRAYAATASSRLDQRLAREAAGG